MKQAKLWIVFFVALLLVIGNVGMVCAAAKPAKSEKRALAKAAADEQPTRDTRKMFGYSVEGLSPVTLILPMDNPLNSGIDAKMVCFAKLVEAESQGKIKIDLHRFGSLYKMTDLPKVCPIGTVHLAGINKGQLMTREIGFAPWVIGYIWKNPEHLMSVVCSPEWYEMEDRLGKDKWNMKPLISATIGNWDYWSRKPITSMNDFRGKKIWTYGELSSAYIAGWGATPVMKSLSELYMAYYSGALDVVSSGGGGILAAKLYEGGKYYVNMPIYPAGSAGIHYVTFYMNLDKWNSLPVAYKKIILDACDLLAGASLWETICSDKMDIYRLINQYKMIDCGLSTKYPKEFEKVKAAAVAAGKKFVFDRGATQKQWDDAQTILNKYADQKQTSRYSWYFKLTSAEADRRLADIQQKIKEGKSWDEAYETYSPKHFYKLSAEQIKEWWLSIPRVKWDWNEQLRLK